MLKKGPLFSIAILFLVLVIGCSPPDTGESKSSSDQPSPSNKRPVACAGSDQAVLMMDASSVTLDGSLSSDPDGDILNYLWTSVDDTVGTDHDAWSSDPKLKVNLPVRPGNYYFVLIVDDGVDYSEPDVVKITVTEPDAWADPFLENDFLAESRFKTIQSAINAVYDGTNGEKAIAIENGLYREKITVQPGIQLFGMTSQDGRAPRAYIVSEAAVGEAVVTLHESTRVENLRIKCLKSSGEATERAAINIIGNNVTVMKCFIVCSKSDGIKLEENASAEIIECVVDMVDGEGIESENSALAIRDSKLCNTGGSAVWGRGCKSVTIENCIIYRTGWHGLDMDNCENVIVDHCTIMDFGSNAADNPAGQSGIKTTHGRTTAITSNLIEIQDLPALIGVNIAANSNVHLTYKYNYIYSRQEVADYYASIETVDSTNYPNSLQTTTDNPFTGDPTIGDFSLNHNSPAWSLGENGTNPGARDAIYVSVESCVPTLPSLISPPKDSINIDPNNIVFKWEPSTDCLGESAFIEYCVVINEDSSPDDIPVYQGCNHQEFLRNTYLSLTDSELKFGKSYFGAVWAKDEDGSFSEVRKEDWCRFSTATQSN